MKSITIRLILVGILLVITFVTGYWLNKTGRPYGMALSTIHKLVALAAVVLATIAVLNLNKEVNPSSIVIVLAISSGLLFLLEIVTGGLLSMENPPPEAIETIHKVIPYVVVLSTAITFYLLMRGR